VAVTHLAPYRGLTGTVVVYRLAKHVQWSVPTLVCTYGGFLLAGCFPTWGLPVLVATFGSARGCFPPLSFFRWSSSVVRRLPHLMGPNRPFLVRGDKRAKGGGSCCVC
jgi:hypothetical protein